MDEIVINRRRAPLLARSAAKVGTSGRRLLWGSDDLLRWAFTIFAGAVVIGVAWYICAGDVSLNQQIGPTDVAVAGLLLSGLGNATWLLRGRRAVGERRRVLLPNPLAQVESSRVARVVTSTSAVQSTPSDAPTEVFLAGPGMELFHRPTCALAAGRSGWTTMTRQEHLAGGRKPCGVCQA